MIFARWIFGLLAGGLAVLPAAGQLPDSRQTPQPINAQPDLRENPLWDIPLNTLAATQERPIFLPARRRPVAPPPAVEALPPPKPSAPEIKPPQLTLVGAIIGSSDAIVIFIDNSTRETLRLRTGEGYAGWILRSAKHSEATLERGGVTVTFAIPRPSGEQK
jgi:hypothetical protein